MRERCSDRRNFFERFNASLVKCLLALWPDENKAWGMAFAAETVAIASPQKQFRWLLGGIPLLLRESLKSFLGSLGRPIGVSHAELIGGSAASQGPRPRTPRVVLVLLLVFVAEFSRLVYAPLSLPESIQVAVGAASGPNGRLLLWSAAIAVLILLAVLLFVRQLRGSAQSE